MKKDYNKPKKIRTNHDFIVKLDAAYQQSLERIKYLEDKLERLWQQVGNVQAASQQETPYNIELIYNRRVSYTNIPVNYGTEEDPDWNYFPTFQTSSVDINDYNTTKSFFKFELECSNRYIADVAWLGYINSGDYIVSADTIDPIPVPFSGSVFLKVWAITVL